MVKQYLEHSRKILTSPYHLFKGGSKEIPIIGKFGHQNEYDLREGFPLLTTKRMAISSIVHELLWFMSGDTNIKYLVDHKVPIWTKDTFSFHLDEMAKQGIFPSGMEKYSPDWDKALAEYEQRVREDGEFAQRWGDAGPIYGFQWRNWRSVDENGKIVKVDQLSNLIERLKTKPTSKKIILTSWNPGELERMALEPCHLLFQVDSNGEVLDLQMYQRSCDQFLGVPFNIASYAMFTTILAQQAGLEPRRFIHTFGNAHFYCGKGERGNWYRDNLDELTEKVKQCIMPDDYNEVLLWLKRNIPPEEEGRETEDKDSYDHVTAIIEQLARPTKRLPVITIANKPFNELKKEDFKLEGYDHYPKIERKMAT